jgi:hypothetical protein
MKFAAGASGALVSIGAASAGMRGGGTGAGSAPLVDEMNSRFLNRQPTGVLM